MSLNIQHKLLQYEMSPPSGTWENIARRLDNEFDISETKSSAKIFDAILEPPSYAWQNILATLDAADHKQKEETKIVPFFTRNRVLAAAVIIGILIIGTWFYRQSTLPVNNEISNVEVTPITPFTDSKKSNEDLINTDEPISAITQLIPQRVRVLSNKSPNFQQAAIFTNETLENAYLSNISEPRTIAKQYIQVIDATEDALIAAPLLRDANGNIIMDMSLLTTSAGNYITVTGPNGEQTHISSKFANFLAYLNNSNSEKEDYLDFLIRQRSSWKRRFEEWRMKILQQASFAPSGSNFFDILELKDLIKD